MNRKGTIEINLFFLTILNLIFSSSSPFSLSLTLFCSLFFTLRLVMLRTTKKWKYLLKGLSGEYFLWSLKMNRKYSCRICTKTVVKSHNGVCGNICSIWVHIKFNNITQYCYRKLQNSNEPWYCKTCLAKVLPFSNFTDHQIDNLMWGKSLASSKQATKENQLTFLNDYSNSVIKLVHAD